MQRFHQYLTTLSQVWGLGFRVSVVGCRTDLNSRFFGQSFDMEGLQLRMFVCWGLGFKDSGLGVARILIACGVLRSRFRCKALAFRWLGFRTQGCQAGNLWNNVETACTQRIHGRWMEEEEESGYLFNSR